MCADHKSLWLARWEQDRIGFHQADTNAYLRQYWPGLGLAAGEPVFVPLCGKSLDMCWLADRRHPVLGVEISPVAVASFYREQGVTPAVISGKEFDAYHAGSVRILCGDYFDLTAEDLQGVGGVYDRASLVSFPEKTRVDYVEHLTSVLNPGIVILLITLDYPPGEMEGPPFPVSDAEVRNLFEPRYAVECLHTQAVLEQNPRFRERGLSRLNESVYRLLYRG